MLTLKPFIRSIKKRKTLSVITIGGYAIGLAVLLIMVSFIISEKSVNCSFENRKNIYRIVRSDGSTEHIPSSLKEDIYNAVPSIEKMSLYNFTFGTFKINDTIINASVIAADDDFLDIFSFEFIYQYPEPTLAVKNNIILTQSFSEKLFGKTNPVGNIINMSNLSYTVVGVVNDVPKTASFSFDALVCKDFQPALKASNPNGNYKTTYYYYSFVLLNKNADIETVKQQISNVSDQWHRENYTFSLEPLGNIYFNTDLADNMRHANVDMIYLLLSIAIVIFFMTIFNYISLTISSGYERLKEIAIKKTAGAGNKDIFWQVLNEAMFVSLVAIFIAVLVAYLIAPLFSDLLRDEIELNFLFSQPLVILGVILLFFLTGILSGIYPALSFSKLLPLQIISRKSNFRNSFRQGGVIAVQFVISICLIISVIAINKQLEYVKHADLGFNRNILRVYISDFERIKTYKEELLKNSNIISVTASPNGIFSAYGPRNGKMNRNGQIKEFQYDNIGIDEDFVKTFDLEIIEGRDLNESLENECIINERFYNELGGENIIDSEINGFKIVGVVRNFNYANLYFPIGNLMLCKDQTSYYLNVKYLGNLTTARETIEKAYTQFFNENIDLSRSLYDDWAQTLYNKEVKQAQSVTLFSIFAVFISCLGLIGMIEQTTHRKIKEIGIRKVNGAKITEILALLNTSIVKWVIIAFIVATPISYYAMNKWLQTFAYKTELSWWIFALSGLLALGIALLTVSFQSWRAATRNPVEALRYE